MSGIVGGWLTWGGKEALEREAVLVGYEGERVTVLVLELLLVLLDDNTCWVNSYWFG